MNAGAAGVLFIDTFPLNLGANMTSYSMIRVDWDRVAAQIAVDPDNATASIAVPLAAGWATATWVALTMHGYWWPGRQLVAVLPLGVIAVLVWLTRHQRVRAPAAGRARARSGARRAAQAVLGRGAAHDDA